MYVQALLDRLAGRPSAFPLKRSTLELMRRHRSNRAPPGKSKQPTTRAWPPSTEPRTPRIRSRPELSGHRRPRPARLRLGYRHTPFQATRENLSYRQLRAYRFHRGDDVAGSGFEQLRHRPWKCDPSAWRPTDCQVEWRYRHAGGPGPTPLRQLTIRAASFALTEADGCQDQQRQGLGDDCHAQYRTIGYMLPVSVREHPISGCRISPPIPTTNMLVRPIATPESRAGALSFTMAKHNA